MFREEGIYLRPTKCAKTIACPKLASIHKMPSHTFTLSVGRGFKLETLKLSAVLRVPARFRANKMLLVRNMVRFRVYKPLELCSIQRSNALLEHFALAL